MGARLCAGMAVRGRGQLGHATLGPTPVPRSRGVGAPASGHALHGCRLLLVPGTARRPQGTQALVRLRRFSPGARGRYGPPHAAGNRRSGHGRGKRPGHSPDGHRQVALLSNPRPLPVRQDRRTDRRHLAAGRPHGGPGDRPGETRDHVLRHDQRAALPPRAGRRARPGTPWGRQHPHRRAGATPQQNREPGTPTARGRRVGARRSALPLEVGTRLPARLPLRGPFHSRTRRECAGAVPHGHGQTRREGGNRFLFSERFGHHPQSLRRRLPTDQSRFRCRADDERGKVFPYSSDSDGRPAAGDARRSDHLLCDTPQNRGSGGISLRQGRRRGQFPRRALAGNEEDRPAAFLRWRITGDRRDQRLRHGHRQTGRAHGDSCRHPRLPGKLPAGSGPRRPRPAAGALRAPLHAR